MRYYTLITCIIVPSIINLFFNALIFKYVRDSTLRVNPQLTSNNTNGTINLNPRLSRREISLLKQMILMFILFIVGWAPAYAINILSIYVPISAAAGRGCQLLDEVAILCVTINFYLINHEMKEYLINQFRRFNPFR